MIGPVHPHAHEGGWVSPWAPWKPLWWSSMGSVRHMGTEMDTSELRISWVLQLHPCSDLLYPLYLGPLCDCDRAVVGKPVNGSTASAMAMLPWGGSWASRETQRNTVPSMQIAPASMYLDGSLPMDPLGLKAWKVSPASPADSKSTPIKSLEMFCRKLWQVITWNFKSSLAPSNRFLHGRKAILPSMGNIYPFIYRVSLGFL